VRSIAALIRLNLALIAAVGLYGIATVLGDGAAAWGAWWYGHRPAELFVDRYFWFVRFGALACAGLVLLTYKSSLRRDA